MAKFSDIYRKELKNKGILSSLGSAALGRMRERMDIRNVLFGGTGVLASTGQKIFGKGYQAIRPSGERLTSPSSEFTSTGISSLLESSQRQEQTLNLIAKNTLNMNSMARDMNVVRQNIITLTKSVSGRSSRGSDALFYDYQKRNSLIKSAGSTPTSPTKAAESSTPSGSFLGSILSGLGSGLLGVAKAAFSLGPVLGVIALAGASYIIKRLAENIDFESISKYIMEKLGLDANSKDSLIVQIAGKIGALFGKEESFKNVARDIQDSVAEVSRTALVYTKAAFMTLAEGFSRLGTIFGYYVNEFFQANKGKIFAAMTISMMGPAALKSMPAAAITALVTGLAGGYGYATGEKDVGELKDDLKKQEEKIAKTNAYIAERQKEIQQGNPYAASRLSAAQTGLAAQLDEKNRIELLIREKNANEAAVLGRLTNMNTSDVFAQNLNIAQQNTAPASKSYRPNAPSSVSSTYGMRTDPFTGKQAMHNGADIPMPIGTDVNSAFAGKVIRVDSDPGYGNFIEIDKGDGRTSIYAHLKEALVSVGDEVMAGQKIAISGNSGRSTGPHLHYEERQNGRPIPPSYLDDVLTSLTRTPGSAIADSSSQLDQTRRDNLSQQSPVFINQGNQGSNAPAASPTSSDSPYNFDMDDLWSKVLIGN